MSIRTRFTDLLGCRHPLQQAGMGGLARPELALAVAGAGALGMLSGVGGFGSLAAQLDALAPGVTVGVNFLVPFLDPAALEDAASRSLYVELFWGEPNADLVEKIHRGGALAGWQVGSSEEARSAVDAGCDLVVAQGIEAGGHVRGTVGLIALLDELRDSIDLPLVAAGGIGSGRAMAAALVTGADAVRVGTRFLAATECEAHPDYVDALIRSEAADTVLTTAYGMGWPDAPHRVLRTAVAAGEALGAAQSWSPEWPTGTTGGPVDAMALYAGQSVGAIRSRQTAAEIVAEMTRGAEASLGHGPALA